MHSGRQCDEHGDGGERRHADATGHWMPPWSEASRWQVTPHRACHLAPNACSSRPIIASGSLVGSRFLLFLPPDDLGADQAPSVYLEKE
jgi:hypothetical protein